METNDVNLTEIENYTTALYQSHQSSHLVYHNLDRTQKLVSRIQEIAACYKLSGRDKFVLYTAGWMHDSGHLIGQEKCFEELSIQIMRNFLNRLEISEDIIIEVANSILATRTPTNPKSKVAAILCDANLYYLGTEEFKETNKLLKKELELRNIKLMGDWDLCILKQLKQHHYFTPYCRNRLNKGKQKNIQELEKISAILR